MITIQIEPERKPDARTDDGYPGRRIEWLGELSPMDDPFLLLGMAMNRLTPEMIAVVRRAALKRVVKNRDGWRAMGTKYEDGEGGGAVIGCDPPGMSRRYVWERRHRWITVLTYADVDKVLSSRDGHEFRDLDATEQDQPAILLPPQEVQPISGFVLKEVSQNIIRLAK